MDGKVVAWARTLAELRKIMSQKGYSRSGYGVVKVQSHDLLAV